MPRRFSRYKWAMKKLAGQVPTSGPFAEFNRYQTGAKIVTYPRDPASLSGGFIKVGIDAFGFGNAALQKILVDLSRRADAQKTAILTTPGVTALGHQPNLADYGDVFGFTPAKAIVFAESATQVATRKDSEITGVPYNPREGNSYTYPFGRTAATDGEADRAKAIQAILNTLPTRKVSFTPERVRV